MTTADVVWVLWGVCVIACPLIAGSKGRDRMGWFILGVLGNFIALCAVAVLRPIEIVADHAGEIQCGHCISWIPGRATVCRYCQRDLHVTHVAVKPAYKATAAPTSAPVLDQGAVIPGHAPDCACRSCFMQQELIKRQMPVVP